VSSKYTRQFLQVFLPVETPYKKNVQMVNNNLMGLRLKSHVVHKGVINKDSYFNHQFESNMQLNQIKKCREVCHKWIKCHKKCNITKMLFCHLILLLYFWEIKKFNQLRAILHEWKIIESRGGGGGEVDNFSIYNVSRICATRNIKYCTLDETTKFTSHGCHELRPTALRETIWTSPSLPNLTGV